MCAKVGDDPIKVRNELAKTCSTLGDFQVPGFLKRCNDVTDKYLEGANLLAELIRTTKQQPKCRPKKLEKKLEPQKAEACRKIKALDKNIGKIRDSFKGMMIGANRFADKNGKLLVQAESAADKISELKEAETERKNANKSKEPVKFVLDEHINIGTPVSTAEFVGWGENPDKDFELAELGYEPKNQLNVYDGALIVKGEFYLIPSSVDGAEKRALRKLEMKIVGEVFVEFTSWLRRHSGNKKEGRAIFMVFDSEYQFIEHYRGDGQLGKFIKFDIVFSNDSVADSILVATKSGPKVIKIK